MHEIADKIIALRLLTRKACMCEKSAKSTLSLKGKLLFLLKKGSLTPQELTSYLCIGKTNLALLTKKMTEDGCITKVSEKSDRRQVCYSLTEKGKAYLLECEQEIELKFKNILTENADIAKALDDFDNVINLLSYL